MKQLIAFLSAGALAFGAMAQTSEEMVFDLTKLENFNKCSQFSDRFDRDDLDAFTFNSYGKYITMYNYQITDGYYDDNLTTPDLDLAPGSMYKVKLTPSPYFNAGNEKTGVNVLLGQGDNVLSYKTLASFEKLPYSSAPEREVTFTVPEEGKYRVSFNCGPYATYLKGVTIVKAGQSAIPAAPDDFTVTPDPDGGLSVTISFTVPGVTITGQDIDNVKYNVYRGFQKIKNAVSATKGEKVTFSETRGEEGMLSYAVEILNGEEVSEKITKETYLGPETPAAPTDVVLALDGNTAKLSWQAPSVGIHGVSLEASMLSYNIVRYIDEVPTTVAEGIAANEFTEEIVADGLQHLKYAVQAIYGVSAKESAFELGNELTIGSIKLPFADSFADATLSSLWDNTLVTSPAAYPGNFNYWQAKPKMEGRMINCDPFDNDGGLLLYNSYSIQKNNSCRLNTPPISFTAGDKPVLSFAMYHIASGDDRLKIQVSCNYGEWQDVEGAVFNPKGTPVNAWSEYNVDLSGAIAEGTTSYRVALLGESEYGQDIVIDAVRIFNLLDKDLEVVNMAIPESVVAGNNLTISLKIANNGSSDVTADGYALEIESDFPGGIVLPELQTIPSLGTVVYNVAIPVNSLHLIDAENFVFKAKIDFDGDQDLSNNVTPEATVTADYGIGASATNLVGSVDDNGNLTIEWTAAKDLEYQPVSLFESFEDVGYAEGSNGPWSGWTTIDLDGAAGERYYSAGTSTFNTCVNPYYPSLSQGRDGNNVIGVSVKSNVTQNDWIISPKLNCRETSSMNLEFLMGVKQVSSYGNSYYVELLYTTDDQFDVLNPQNNFTNKVGTTISSTSTSDKVLPQNNNMYPLQFTDIPGEAKYVALHFTSKGSYSPAMWIDKLNLYEVDDNSLLGYHVYEVNGAGRLTDELIPSDATSYVVPTMEVATFASEAKPKGLFVTAVYPDGEAKPSNFLQYDKLTDGIDRLVEAVEAGECEYYNLQGIRVANPTEGIYIMRNGAKATKIVIK